MKNLWINIKIEVRDHEYNYNANKGEGSIDFSFPENMLDKLDFGTIIEAVKESALTDYKNSIQEPTENKEN